MRRVIVLGASGFFGGLIYNRLQQAGLNPLAASRSSGDFRIDANDGASIRASIKTRDVVVDAAGPFHTRTPALIQTARTIGFDVIDISDSPEYTGMIYEQQAPISAAGIRVLTACSSLSAVSALMTKTTGIDQPKKLTVYLVPASRYTANRGAVTSYLSGVTGESRTLHFPHPVGTRSGITVKSVDSVTLPRIFPSLQSAEFVVDAGTPGGNLIARFKGARDLMQKHQDKMLKLAKRIGPKQGVLAYDITTTGRRRQFVYTGEQTYLIAVIPAIDAAIAIANARFTPKGIVPPTQHMSLESFRVAVEREEIQTIAV